MLDEEFLRKWEGWMQQDDCWKYVSEPKDLREMLGEIRRLREELLEQWLSNHAEHCGKLPAQGHEGLCHWPLPALLGAAGKQDGQRVRQEEIWFTPDGQIHKL